LLENHKITSAALSTAAAIAAAVQQLLQLLQRFYLQLLPCCALYCLVI
jgi:hypothetical protein